MRKVVVLWSGKINTGHFVSTLHSELTDLKFDGLIWLVSVWCLWGDDVTDDWVVSSNTPCSPGSQIIKLMRQQITHRLNLAYVFVNWLDDCWSSWMFLAWPNKPRGDTARRNIVGLRLSSVTTQHLVRGHSVGLYWLGYWSHHFFLKNEGSNVCLR